MNFSEKYFQRVNTFEQKIYAQIPDDLQIITVIPVYNEPEIYKTVDSILLNEFEGFSVEVIFVINSSENDDCKVIKQNQITNNFLKNYEQLNSDKKISFFVLHFSNLPKKHSGVGVARKIGMDEALRRFSKINRSNGIITSLDADTIVQKNYFQSIFNHFQTNPKSRAANIYFEHPIKGNEYSKDIYEAVKIYELYMRYYVQALRFTGFPFAFHTIGSAFCFTSKIYAEQGGMVTNQAGEDFYFLQKLIPVSNFSEINKTTIIPSPRITDRVVFGTGVAVNQIINNYKFG